MTGIFFNSQHHKSHFYSKKNSKRKLFRDTWVCYWFGNFFRVLRT